MSDIAISWTADEKDVQRALQNMVKENAKLRAEIGLGVQESKAAAAQEREWQKLREKATKEATQQMAQLNSAAQRIKDSVASPFEEAKKKTAELRDHLQAGRITVDEYRLAYSKVAKEMKEATRDHAAEAEAAKAAAAAKADAAKKAAEAERDHAQAMREASAIADKYATKEERVAAEMKRLNALKERGVLSSKDYARAVEAEQKKLTETGEAADKSGGLIGGLTSRMATFVSGLASGAAVIATIKAEYDALIERQGKSKDANLSLAAEQEALLMNLGGADAAAVTNNIGTLSRRSGIKEENVTRAINEAMAARGDLGVDSVVNAVGSVSKIRKFAPSEMAGLAAATIDTQKQTGLGTDQALGFLLQMQGQSRTKNLKGLAENFTPAIGGVMNFGADRQTAGAMLAALSHGMGDTSGAMTGTSGIQLAKQLRAFSGGADIGTTITRMQQDPEMRKRFLGSASFEAKALPAVESLLSGGTQAKQFAAARIALSQDPMIALNEAIKSRTASQAIALAQTDQAFGNVVDQQRLADKKGAESSIVRERMAEIRKQMGGSVIGNTVDGVLADITSNGMQTADNAVRNLERKAQLLKEGRDDSTEMFRSSPGMARNPAQYDAMVQRNLRDAEFVKQAKLLEDVVSLLRAQLELQKQADDAARQNNHAGNVAARAAQGGG